MNIAEIKTYVESHMQSAGDELKAKFSEVVAFVQGKEAEAVGIAQEIADLTAKGYVVTGPFPSATEVQP